MPLARRARVAALLVALLPACSFGMTTVPKHPDPAQPPNCTDSLVAPIVDGSIAVGAGAGALYVRSTGDDDGFDDVRRMGISFLLIATAAYAISTGYGIVHQRRCRHARDAYAQSTRAAVATESRSGP